MRRLICSPASLPLVASHVSPLLPSALTSGSFVRPGYSAPAAHRPLSTLQGGDAPSLLLVRVLPLLVLNCSTPPVPSRSYLTPPPSTSCPLPRSTFLHAADLRICSAKPTPIVLALRLGASPSLWLESSSNASFVQPLVLTLDHAFGLVACSCAHPSRALHCLPPGGGSHALSYRDICPPSLFQSAAFLHLCLYSPSSRRRATPTRSIPRDAGVNRSASLRASSASPSPLKGPTIRRYSGVGAFLFFVSTLPAFLGPLKIIYLPLRRRSRGPTSMCPTPRPLSPAVIPRLSFPRRHCFSTPHPPHPLHAYAHSQQRPFFQPSLHPRDAPRYLLRTLILICLSLSNAPSPGLASRTANQQFRRLCLAPPPLWSRMQHACGT